MGAARGVWTAALHPHGTHGRWTSTGGTKKTSPKNLRETDGRSRRTLAEHVSAVFGEHRTGGRVSVTKWEPGIWSGKDARIKLRYDRGQLGPPEAGYRPVLRAAGWKPVGHKAMPPGSTLAAMKKTKARKNQMTAGR